MLKDEEELRQVPIKAICENPFQPRRHFSQEELIELSQSIKSVGLLHPPVVRPSLDEGLYELISGERRWRAAQLAGLQSISVIIRHSTAAHSAEAALVENIQRVDLNPIEVARALRQLMNQFGYSQEVLAGRVGKKRSTIANYLRLLSLPKIIQESVSSETISMGHAKALLSISSIDQQLAIHDKIVKEGLTVRIAEEIAQRQANKEPSAKGSEAKGNIFLEDIAKILQSKLGTKVVIEGGEKGSITIDYYSLDDLDRLLRCFGIET